VIERLSIQSSEKLEKVSGQDKRQTEKQQRSKQQRRDKQAGKRRRQEAETETEKRQEVGATSSRALERCSPTREN